MSRLHTSFSARRRARIFSLAVAAVVTLLHGVSNAITQEEAFEQRAAPEFFGVSIQMHPSVIADRLEQQGFKTKEWYLENGEHVRLLVSQRANAPFSSIEVRFCTNPHETIALFFESSEPEIYYPLLRDRLAFRNKDRSPDESRELGTFGHYERIFADGASVDFGTDSSELKLHLRITHEDRRARCRSEAKAARDHLESTRKQRDRQEDEAARKSL